MTRTSSLTVKQQQWWWAQKASVDTSDSHTCQWWRCQWCWFDEAAAGPGRKLAAKQAAMRGRPEQQQPHHVSEEEEEAW